MKFERTVLAAVSMLVLSAASTAQAQGFSLWVTETPPGGSTPYNTRVGGGVRSYLFDGLGYGAGNYATGPTIAAGSLNDPAAVTADAAGNLYISNRGFNVDPGSVSKVAVAANGAPGAPTVVLSGIPVGPHQTALDAAGGLAVTSFNSGTALYPLATAPAAQTYASGTPRGASIAGGLLYSTAGGGAVQTFDLASGALDSTFSVPGAAFLHYSTLHDGALYVADIGGGFNGAQGAVYKVSLDAVTGQPTSSAKVVDVPGAISLVFSPTGNELLVATHYSGFVYGFAVGAGDTVAVAPNLVIDGGTLPAFGQHVTFGGLAITPLAAVPEPASFALMLAGLAAVAAVARRRSGAAA